MILRFIHNLKKMEVISFFKNAFINFSTNSFKSEKTKIDIHKEVLMKKEI